MASSMGWDATVSINSTSMMVRNGNFGKRGSILERVGTRGSRTHNILDTRQGPYRVNGGFTLEPSHAELDVLLNWALDVTALTVIVDRVAAVYTYAGVKCNSLTLTGGEGKVWECAVDLIGTSEAATGSAPSAPESAIPFVFSDLVLTLASVPTTPKSVELRINNALDGERFLNALSVGTLNATDRIVTLKAIVPFDATHLALYNQAYTGATGTMVLNNGTNTDTLTFGALQVPADAPEIPGKDEIYLTLDMVARANGATADIALT